MPYSLNLLHLTTAFSSGRLNGQGAAIEFQVATVGDLVVRSGAIAASDALVVPDHLPFAQPVPTGRFPVDVAIARFDNQDERIAFARITFSTTPAVAWQMATVAGQDTSALGGEEYFGYGVDSGTGCFMDPVAGQLLTRRMHADQQYFNTIIDGMARTYRHTRSWTVVSPSPDHDENVICFSSGYGDGTYPSFFGFDEHGNVTALVTDFGVIDDSGEPVAPSERKPWWQIW